MVPWSVPKAIVSIGTWALRAAATASLGGRPEPDAPSDINTMRAGTGVLFLSGGTVLMASREEKIASPIAVRSPSSRVSMARLAGSRSWVGSTLTDALPWKATMPMLILSGTLSRKRCAASIAACRRVGLTSSAAMDSEVSMASTTVPRLVGTFWVRCGCASARTSATMPMLKQTAPTWRFQSRRLGTTDSSSLRLVKRAVTLGLANCTAT